MAEESDKKLLAAASALVSTVKELKDQIKGGDPSGSKGKAPVPKKPVVDPTRKQFQQTQSVAIQKFSDKSLMRLANAVKQDEVVDDKEAPAKEPKWWKKLIGPALLIFGGIAAFVYGLLSDSKVSGFFKVIGKVGVMGGIMLAAKLIGTAIKPVLKFLPVIGAILDLADAYFRFKKGELGQGLLSLIAGIANFVPVVGPMLSLGIGVINAFIDFNPGAKKFVNQKLPGLFGLILKLFLPYLKIFKMVPFLGSIISFGMAYMRFKQGNLLGGAIDLLSGVAGLFPGVGQAIMWGLGILNAVLDMTGASERAKEPGGTGSVLKDIALKLGQMIIGLTPIGWIIGGIKGIKLISQGKVKEGLFKMAEWMGPLGMLAEWIFGPEESPEKGEDLGEKGGFWSSVKDFILKYSPIGVLIKLYKGIKKVFTGEMKLGLMEMAYAFPATGMIAKWLGGPSTAEEAAEDIGKKDGFWSKVKHFIVNYSPIGILVKFAKGIKKVFTGQMKLGLMEMAYAIPATGMIAKWLGGPETAEEAADSLSDKKSFWSRVKQFIMGTWPIAPIVGIYKGIKYALQGQWKKAGISFMYGIPFVGTVIAWMGGPDTAEGAAEDIGKKDGFFASIKNWMVDRYPIKNLLQFIKGIKGVFSGDIFGGFLNMAYAIPFFGSIVKFFGGPETAEQAEEAGERSGLWSIVKDYIMNLYPISNILHIWKGIKAIFKGEWSTAAEHFMYSVPIVGNVLGFFAGASPAEKGDQEKAPNVFQKIRDGVFNKFKTVWKKTPGAIKWMGRRILPDSILAKLDNPGPEYHDKIDLQHSGSPDSIPPTPNPYASAAKALLENFRPIWKKMGKASRWIARRILPDRILRLLDNPDPAYHDDQDTPLSGQADPEPRPQNPFAVTRKFLIEKYRVIWQKLPKWMKFVAKAILPGAIYDLLSKAGGDQDTTTPVGMASSLDGGVNTMSKGLQQATNILVAARNRLITNTQKFADELSKTTNAYGGAQMYQLVAVQRQMLSELRSGNIKRVLDEIYTVLDQRLGAAGQGEPALNIPVLGGGGGGSPGPNGITTQRAQSRPSY